MFCVYYFAVKRKRTFPFLLNAYVGESIQFYCYSNSEVSWYFNGSKLPHGKKYQFQKINVTSFPTAVKRSLSQDKVKQVYMYTLTIKNIILEDKGEYICFCRVYPNDDHLLFNSISMLMVRGILNIYYLHIPYTNSHNTYMNLELRLYYYIFLPDLMLIV